MEPKQSLDQIVSRVIKEQPVSDAFRQSVELRLRRVEQQQRWRAWSLKLLVAASLILVFWKLAVPPRASQLSLDLVGHHETCWEVPSSEARSQQYQNWLHSHPGLPLAKGDRMGRSLHLFDRRGCPVLATSKSPHWMFRAPKSGMVSIFLFTANELKAYGTLPTGVQEDLCGKYRILTWTDEGCLWALVAQAPAGQMQEWIRQGALSGFNPQSIAAVAP